MVVRRISNDELYHHGVKGQQWGKRHGPPYPLGSDVSTGSRLKKITSNDNKTAKRVVKRVNDAISNNKGHTQIQLSDAQKKVIIGAVAAVAGLTLAAGAVYVAKKYNLGYNRNLELKTKYNTVIKDVSLYRYQNGKVFDPNDGFSMYQSFGILDRMEYSTHNMAMSIKEAIKEKKLSPLSNHYLMSFKGENLVIPSLEESHKIFGNALKDSSIQKDLLSVYERNLNKYYNERKSFSGLLPANQRRINIIKRAIESMKNGNINDDNIKDIYDAWNIVITNNKGSEWNVTNKIFNMFKDNGYQGIWDTHDLYISSLKSSNPMILFDKTALTQVGAHRINALENVTMGALVGLPTTAAKNLIKSLSNITIL